MPAKIIAGFNHAGGVMKTTLLHNLGHHLHDRGHRVLLIDLDPQASLTVFCGLNPFDLNSTIRDALAPEDEEDSLVPLPIHSLETGLDIVPANLDLAETELALVTRLAGERELARILEPVRSAYAVILIDCPPSLGMLSYNALTASTHVIIPIQTQEKALQGTGALFRTISRIRKRVNPNLQPVGVVPTLFQNTNHDRQVLDSIQQQLQDLMRVFSPVPRSIALADASLERKALVDFKKFHPAVAIFDEITDAIETLL